jgi:hypothetical protein
VSVVRSRAETTHAENAEQHDDHSQQHKLLQAEMIEPRENGAIKVGETHGKHLLDVKNLGHEARLRGFAVGLPGFVLASGGGYRFRRRGLKRLAIT